MGENAESEERAEASREPHTRVGPLVFISHDSRDADLAEAFSRLLSTVSAGMLKSFRSSDRKGVQGIDFGVEWYPELMSKLDAACDVVCLLTARSLGRPWILYEAGVAKGKLDIPVHGLALGVPLSSVSGPFAQFQNCDDSGDALTKLVEQLIRRLPHADPDHETVIGQVTAFKARVDEILAAHHKQGDEADVEPDDTSTAKLFEEIKVMFQDLPSRVDSVAEHSRHGPRRRRRPLDPRMLEEFVMMSSRRREPNLGIAALIMTSPYREDLPWIYTMAVELYRASLSGDREAMRRCQASLIDAVEAISRGPFLPEILGGSRRDIDILMHELPRFLDHLGFFIERSSESESGGPDIEE